MGAVDSCLPYIETYYSATFHIILDVVLMKIANDLHIIAEPLGMWLH